MTDPLGERIRGAFVYKWGNRRAQVNARAAATEASGVEPSAPRLRTTSTFSTCPTRTMSGYVAEVSLSAMARTANS